MNPLLARQCDGYFPSGPRQGRAAFRVGTEAFPFLADHGFQGLTVLPGAFYVELALAVHLDLLRAPPGRIRRVEFAHPVILAEGEVPLAVEAEPCQDEAIRYTFREAGAPACATLEIACGARTDPRRPFRSSTPLLSQPARTARWTGIVFTGRCGTGATATARAFRGWAAYGAGAKRPPAGWRFPGRRPAKTGSNPARCCWIQRSNSWPFGRPSPAERLFFKGSTRSGFCLATGSRPCGSRRACAPGTRRPRAPWPQISRFMMPPAASRPN